MEKTNNSSSCSVNMEEWEGEELEEHQYIAWVFNTNNGRVTLHFITIENEYGSLEQIQVQEDEAAAGSYFNPIALEDGDKSDDFPGLSRNGSIPNTKYIKDYKLNERRRIVSKTGDCNIQLYRVNRKRRRFIKDIFTTMVDIQWRYTLLTFVASFFISWLLFAVIWYIIAYVHGDFLQENLPDNQATSDWTPCIYAVYDFGSVFLFSVETQHTIGYGLRGSSHVCPEAIILECIQSVVGVIIQACMAGIVFAKLSRPKSRTITVMFSKNAVISKRNGHLYLLFRVGDLRTSHLLESHVRAQLVRKVKTDEGENIHFHQEELKVGTDLDGEDDRALILWPLTISHRIDSESPFWRMTPKDLLKSKFEIIVTLEGVIEATGNTTQARSSYLPSEILWNHRFDNMVSYAKKQGVYAVDCSSLNRLVPDNTPRLSAYQLEEIKRNRKASKISVQNKMKKLSLQKSSILHHSMIQSVKKLGGGDRMMTLLEVVSLLSHITVHRHNPY